jgi:predicted ribosome quality control (RQC) complex YloA/Tae2 family protein
MIRQNATLVANGGAVAYIRVMQTSLHIMALVAALQEEAVGGRIVATEFYKKERAAYLFIKRDKKRLALGFRYHPAGSGLFLVAASKIRLDTREKPRPFFSLDDAVVVRVEQLGLDRIFTVTLEQSKTTTHLLCEALGPNGNLWHLDESLARLTSLRKKSFTVGTPYEPPPPPDRIDPRGLTVDSLQTVAAAGPKTSLRLFLEKNLHGFSRSLAFETVTRADCVELTKESADKAACERLARQIGEIVDRFKRPPGGFLYESPGGVEVFPFRLKTSSETPTKFKTLSLATLALCDLKRSAREEADDEKRLSDAVNRHLKKLERRSRSIERDIAQAADFEQYKKWAELLQINFGKLRTGLTQITLDDVYLDPPQPTTIPLEDAVSPRLNIEAYFKKYRKGRDGLQLLRRRLEITSEEIAAINQIQAALEADFESAHLRYEQELAALAPKSSPGRPAVSARLPYREYRLSTGLRLLVGRDGTDNDRTTFDHARPFELWFHAQQCAGSHVVLKFPNKSFAPSKAEIEEAAAVAAYHSKARKDSLVAVIYTERRHVRKPRKAKPGLVTVQREKSLMVSPRQPQSD